METNIKTLDDVRAFLNKIPFLNSGGCGVSALAMYRWLKKNMPEYAKKTTFHFFHRGKYEYDNNRKLIKTNSYSSDNLIVPSHIGIKVKGLTKAIIDSEGFVHNVYGYVVKTDLEDVLINALKNYNSWNFMFDRNKSISFIEKHLGIDLDDVTIEEY